MDSENWLNLTITVSHSIIIEAAVDRILSLVLSLE
jgi:hypothetical protein